MKNPTSHYVNREKKLYAGGIGGGNLGNSSKRRRNIPLLDDDDDEELKLDDHRATRASPVLVASAVRLSPSSAMMDSEAMQKDVPERRGFKYYCCAFWRYTPWLVLISFLGCAAATATAMVFSYQLRRTLDDWETAVSQAIQGSNVTIQQPMGDTLLGEIIYHFAKYSSSGAFSLLLALDFFIVLSTVPWELCGCCCESLQKNWDRCGTKCVRLLTFFVPVVMAFGILCVYVGALCSTTAVGIGTLVLDSGCAKGSSYASVAAALVNERLPIAPGIFVLSAPVGASSEQLAASASAVEQAMKAMCAVEPRYSSITTHLFWMFAAWIVAVYCQALLLASAALRLQRVRLLTPPEVFRRQRPPQEV